MTSGPTCHVRSYLRCPVLTCPQVARAAPFVEKLVAKGFEVLYLTDAIDEATVTNLQKYADKELVDVSKEGLNVSNRAVCDQSLTVGRDALSASGAKPLASPKAGSYDIITDGLPPMSSVRTS